MKNEEVISQYSLKYRPRKWEDVYGQESTVKDLRERILKDDIPTAVLFQGPFGCGKTSLCEIFSAAIQAHTEDGNPDWNHPSCKAISSGSFDRDTVRLDSAQLSGKADIIEYTQDLNTRPIFDRRKILIIEECDQISSAGMSSLLKILEGVKPWVTIILLSMEDKVSGAIKSRCQVYKIKPIGIRDIMLNLKHIMECTGDWTNESIPKAFRIEGLGCIATAAQGSMRSAVQYLEQCINCEAWTPAEIDDLLGIIDEEKTWKILDGLLEKTKDDSIWQTLLHLKTGEETNHFFNYATMLLAEVIVYKETGEMYDENAKWRFEKMVKSPYLEDLFYCLTLHPQMNKPYLRTSDLLGCLMCYYQGLDFKPSGGKKVTNHPEELIPLKEERLKIGVENPKLLEPEPPIDGIPIRKPKTDIGNINIVF